ncbi:MAG: fused MFS/spermidine synthase, partial [Blastocatellia bacterium]|nr:fused MFS/spermidine synthase [Blastocatellia bacterium]
SRGRGKGVSATDHRPALLRRPAWPFALFGPRRARRERNQTRKKGRSKLASEPRLRAQDAETFGRAQLVTVLVGFALSGFVALSYEVIWSRVLALIIGSSVYAFSIMLMTFLIGLALGATFASRIVDRIRRPVFTFALIEIGVGITSLIGAYLFNELPYIFVQIYGWLEGSAFAVLLLARFLVASFVMIVPTLMLGAIFPLVVRIISASRGALAPGRTVGDAYAANTVGAIAGSFASGFVLIPWLGLLGSLKVSAALNFVVAGALFLASRRSMDRRAVSKHVDAKTQKDAAPPPRLSMPFGLRGSALAGCCVAAALVLVVVVFDPPWDSDVMSSAVYRYAPSLSKMSRREFSEYLRNGQGETLFYREGITSTIAVQRQSGHLVLKANGKPEASTAGDMPTQVLIGALPLLARRQSDDVLLIGLGSGVTLGTIEQFPVKRVTCVELEPAMIEASRFFDDVNNRPLDDPRLRMVANDGRNYIYTTGERFDVIVSEPSNPWVTGVANLFTLEYFKRGADRLKEGGLFSQWLQIYEMPPEDVKVLTATFHAAFPYVHIFRGAEGDLMLLGSRSPIELNREVIESHFADKRIASELGRVNTNSAGDLLSRFYLGTSEVARFSAGAPINTDDNALIEFSAPRHVGTAEETVELNVQQLLSAAGSPLPYMGEETMIAGTQADFLLEAALGAVKRKDESRAEQFARYSLDIFETARTHGVLGELRFARKDEQAALDHWHRALELEPDHFYTLINMGKLYLGREDAPRAAPYLDRAIKADPKSARARHLRGLAYQVAGDDLSAVLEYRKALPDAKYARSTENFYLNFGTALVRLGLYEESAQMFEEYVKLAPKDYEGRYQLGAVYEILAERTLDDPMTYRAIDELKRALTLKPDHAMSHYYLSKAYRRLGQFDEAEAEFQMYENLTP